MKTTHHPFRRGFTLIELSLAMSMGIVISTMVLSLFNLQINFLKIYQRQSFLYDEAPLISMYVSKMVSKADRFRLHASVADAVAQKNPVLSSDPPPTVAWLDFRQPDGSLRSSMLAFEDRGAGKALYYYIVPAPPGVLGQPQWVISNKPKDVGFAVVNGILDMTLTGPDDEQITYSGTMQQ